MFVILSVVILFGLFPHTISDNKLDENSISEVDDVKEPNEYTQTRHSASMNEEWTRHLKYAETK